MEKTNSQLNNKKIALFFTYAVSLEIWEKKGMLQRELALYKTLGKHVGQIYFVTYGENDAHLQEELAPYNITILPKRRKMPHFLYSFFIPFIYRNELSRCDIYKTNQMLGSWTGVIAKLLFKKPLIVRTGYSLSVFSKKQYKIKYFFSRCIELFSAVFSDKIVVATDSEMSMYSRWKDKVIVTPNYVDTNVFSPQPKKGQKQDKTIILYIGRLSRQKNVHSLIQALSGIPDIRLSIIGDGALKGELIALAGHCGVDVEFLGVQPYTSLPQFINGADIFVLPSLYEGNPKVLLEAMACGATVLATNVEGIKNIIDHTQNGYLSDTSSQGLHHAIVDLLGHRETYAHLGASARESVLQHNALASVVVKELSLLEDLLSLS